MFSEYDDPRQTRPAYQSVDQAYCHELAPIKGSRFIAYLTPVHSDEAAIGYWQQLRQQHMGARHWCYAYQLYQGNGQARQRFHDDGEPTGSAGRPILAPIVGYPLHDVIIVVVRYFGGVQLGVGGLVRAYSQASQTVIQSATCQSIIPKTTLRIRFAYDDSNAINARLAALNLEPSACDYGEFVCLTLPVADAEVSHTLNELYQACAGRLLDWQVMR